MVGLKEPKEFATEKLNFVWCEKKAKDSDYLWLASNNFKREKGNIKLLDGIQQSQYDISYFERFAKEHEDWI
ncbi:hypothetical protein PS15p_210018 [Mucor circinelloides]